MGVQLMLGFEQPSQPVSVHLRLHGLRVLVETVHGLTTDAFAYLSHCGAEPEIAEPHGLSFNVSNVLRLKDAEDSFMFSGDDHLRPLVRWVTFPPEARTSADLAVSADGHSLWLSWHPESYSESAGDILEALTEDGTSALVASGLPFIPSPPAFERLKQLWKLPLTIGACHQTRTGYIQVKTSLPSLLEASELPGMFREDETTYGVPMPYLNAFVGKAGFVWDGPPLHLDRGPATLPALPAKLSTHATRDLRPLVDALAAYRTQLVRWDSGLGRRVFVLAALESLDAYPLVVICHPKQVWQWWRHAEMFSRTPSTNDPDADIKIVTYSDFAADPFLAHGAQAVVFDDIASPGALSDGVSSAAGTLAGTLDCYLVGLTHDLPTDQRQALHVMARLRPHEFNPSVSLLDRYGRATRARLNEHVMAYVSTRRQPPSSIPATRTRQTQVVAVEMPHPLQEDLDALPSATLEEQRSMASHGSQLTLSPKIPAAVSLATDAASAGMSVALVTRYEKTALLLFALLAPSGAVLADRGSQPANLNSRLVIVQGYDVGPQLHSFNNVVFLDYPDSYDELVAMVGECRDEQGPVSVSLLHLEGSVDEWLGVHAGRTLPLH